MSVSWSGAPLLLGRGVSRWVLPCPSQTGVADTILSFYVQSHQLRKRNWRSPHLGSILVRFLFEPRRSAFPAGCTIFVPSFSSVPTKRHNFRQNCETLTRGCRSQHCVFPTPAWQMLVARGPFSIPGTQKHKLGKNSRARGGGAREEADFGRVHVWGAGTGELLHLHLFAVAKQCCWTSGRRGAKLMC